ncbi:MAG TPA: ATP-binding protein, partial [Chloroflexota bacterium]
VLALLGLGVALSLSLRATELRRLEGDLRRQALVVAEGALARWETQGEAGVVAFVEALGRADADLRVAVLDAQGQRIADSHADRPGLVDPRHRPETARALDPAVREPVVALDDGLLAVATPLRRGGDALGVAWVALSPSRADRLAEHARSVVALALVPTAVAAVALAFVVARATVDPLRRLAEMARRLAAGEWKAEPGALPRDEVAELGRALAAMAHKLHAEVATIEDERRRWRVVLEEMADGLVVTDGSGRVLLLNRVAEQLLHVQQSWAVGRSFVQVVRDHELADHLESSLRAPDGRPRSRIVEAGPGRRALRVVITTVPNRGERQALVILQDLTELRRLERVRRDFVANVSHELRTPLASLKALVETLEGGALDDPTAARDFLARMHVEVDGLVQLVEELLALSRLEDGRADLRPAPTPVAELVGRAVERLRPQADRAGVALAADVPADLPLVLADPARVQQVIMNLVHNAVKFTPPGGSIRVTADRWNGQVAVRVIDTGVGIDAEDLPRIFERFYKADRSRASTGTGLGLAIAKHLVLAHGGRIWAESPGLGQGSTFTFTLPVAPAAASPRADDAPTA